jgi:uncharacterized protein YlaI
MHAQLSFNDRTDSIPSRQLRSEVLSSTINQPVKAYCDGCHQQRATQQESTTGTRDTVLVRPGSFVRGDFHVMTQRFT